MPVVEGESFDDSSLNTSEAKNSPSTVEPLTWIFLNPTGDVLIIS